MADTAFYSSLGLRDALPGPVSRTKGRSAVPSRNGLWKLQGWLRFREGSLMCRNTAATMPCGPALQYRQC
jgi:hypothetical protein